MSMEDRPGLEEILEPELKRWVEAKTMFSNAIGQYDHILSWEDVIWAVGDLEDVLADIRHKVTENLRRWEEEEEDDE